MPACTPPAALALRLGRATADRAPESPRRAAAICLTRRSAPAALLYVCAVYVLCVRCVCASHARYRGPATLLLLQGLDLLCASGSAAAAATASEASQRGGLAARMAAALLSSLRAAPPSLLVVGAARRPRALPAGLRAHGGFETLMELPPPSAAQRRQLLHRLLGQLGTAAPAGAAAGTEGAAVAVDAAAGAAQLVEDLVGRTGGFTPGDLRALLRAAATRAALRRTGAGAADAAEGGGVPCWDDCAKALQHAAPSARGDFGDPLPLTRWSDVGGYAAQRARLQRLVEWPQAQGGHSRRLGVEPPSGALLYGPSGNGKSLLVHALASSCGCTVLSAKGSQLFGEYVGDAEASIRALFQQAREAAPAIVFIDEIDALGAKRDCEAVLEEDPGHLKCRFRRAQALVDLGSVEDACVVFVELARVPALQRDARRALRAARATLKAHRDAERELYRGVIRPKPAPQGPRPEKPRREALERTVVASLGLQRAAGRAASDSY